jgi:hypothetical protein
MAAKTCPRRIGLIAQQVEDVVPYMVTTRDARDLPDVRVMSTQPLAYLLVNAMHELEARVADLERRLADAEARAAASQQPARLSDASRL